MIAFLSETYGNRELIWALALKELRALQAVHPGICLGVAESTPDDAGYDHCVRQSLALFSATLFHFSAQHASSLDLFRAEPGLFGGIDSRQLRIAEKSAGLEIGIPRRCADIECNQFPAFDRALAVIDRGHAISGALDLDLPADPHDRPVSLHLGGCFLFCHG